MEPIWSWEVVTITSEDGEIIQQDLKSLQILYGKRGTVRFNTEMVQVDIPGENNQTHRYFVKEALRKQKLK